MFHESSFGDGNQPTIKAHSKEKFCYLSALYVDPTVTCSMIKSRGLQTTNTNPI